MHVNTGVEQVCAVEGAEWGQRGGGAGAGRGKAGQGCGGPGGKVARSLDRSQITQRGEWLTVDTIRQGPPRSPRDILLPTSLLLFP